MNWDTRQFGSLYEEKTRNGVYKPSEYHGHGIKIVNMGELFAYGRVGSQAMERVELNEKEIENSLLKEDDLLFARRSLMESGAGKVSIVQGLSEDTTFESSVIRVRLNKKICDPLFYYYWFNSYQGRGAIQPLVTGVNVKGIRGSELADIKVDYPSIEIQRKVCRILSTYDDLIENNQKQIKLLEEAAQRLYKEWFIDLRFPGHENTPIHDGVPEGWERKTIGELISYEIGGGWGEEEPSNNADNGAFVIRGTDLYGLTHGSLMEVPFRYHGKNNLAARMLQDGDIVFEVSGGSRTEGVARTALIRKDMLARWVNPVICASFCKLIRPIASDYSQYLFDHFQYLRSSGKTEEYDKRSASSIVNYRWKDFLSQETMLEPSKPIIDLYNQNATILYNAIVAQSLQIETARKARDRLLPKLMSGEIEV